MTINKATICPGCGRTTEQYKTDRLGNYVACLTCDFMATMPTVEDPGGQPCETCRGEGWRYVGDDRPGETVDCPTCRGDGIRGDAGQEPPR